MRFRFWRREEVRMWLEDSSALFIPRPMTSKSFPSSSLPSWFPGSGFFFFFSFPAIAKSSSLVGK